MMLSPIPCLLISIKHPDYLPDAENNTFYVRENEIGWVNVWDSEWTIGFCDVEGVKVEHFTPFIA